MQVPLKDLVPNTPQTPEVPVQVANAAQAPEDVVLASHLESDSLCPLKPLALIQTSSPTV